MKIYFFSIFLFLYVQLNANNFFKSYCSQSYFSYNDSVKRNNSIKLVVAPIQIGTSLEIEPFNKYYVELGSTILPPKSLFNLYIQNKYQIYRDSSSCLKLGFELSYFYGEIFGVQKIAILIPLYLDYQYKRFGLQLCFFSFYFYHYNSLEKTTYAPKNDKTVFTFYLRLSYKFKI